MPVDPDAYMAGAIPTLSRGGSWLPSESPRSRQGSIPGSKFAPSLPAIPVMHHGSKSGSIHSSPGSPMILTPPDVRPSRALSMGLDEARSMRVKGQPLYSSGTASLVAPPSVPSRSIYGSSPSVSPSQAQAPRTRANSTAYSELAGAASTHGLRREQHLGPVLHHGWLKVGSGSVAGQAHSLNQGDEWEYQGGAPKPMSPEPEYGLKRIQHPTSGPSAASGSLSQTPLPDHVMPPPIAYHKIAGHTAESRSASGSSSPSPYKKVIDPLSSRKAQRDPQMYSEAAPSAQGRPTLSRRHSHTPSNPHVFDDSQSTDVLSPKPRRAGQEDLFRSAQINSRLARLSLQGRECHTPDPTASPLFPDPTSSASPIPRGFHSRGRGEERSVSGSSRKNNTTGDIRQRASLERRHSSSETVPAPSSSLPAATTPAQHRAVSQLKRTRHMSAPHSRSPPPGSVPSPPSSAAPLKQVHKPRTTPPPPPPVDRAAAQNTRIGSKQFPRAEGPDQKLHSVSGSLRTRTYSEADTYPSRPASHDRSHSPVLELSQGPPGYISPLADDPYDRYSPHPAAPVPERADRCSSHSRSRSPSFYGGASIELPSSQAYAYAHFQSQSQAQARVETPADAGVTTEKQREYIPPMFVKPTRDLAWNRVGPAMKTHGIAWLREEDVDSLPQGPRGPRWEVARPPRAAQLQGGSWWESGGDGTAYGG